MFSFHFFSLFRFSIGVYCAMSTLGVVSVKGAGSARVCLEYIGSSFLRWLVYSWCLECHGRFEYSECPGYEGWAQGVLSN